MATVEAIALLILTYNVGLMPPNKKNYEVERLLWQEEPAKVDSVTPPGIYVIGLQETVTKGGKDSAGSRWMEAIRTEMFLNGYAQISDVVRTEGALLAVFCLYNTVKYVKNAKVTSGNVRFGAGSAVYLNMRVGGKLWGFANIQMPRTETEFSLKQRKEDLMKVKGALETAGPLHQMFWFGSMHFSEKMDIPITTEEVTHWAKRGKYEEILSYDQLNYLLNVDDYLQKFTERKITFPPTYKYLTGSDDYDISDPQLFPGYTDRIFISNYKANIVWESYKHNSALSTGQHRPVSATFSIKDCPILEVPATVAFQSMFDYSLLKNDEICMYTAKEPFLTDWNDKVDKLRIYPAYSFVLSNLEGSYDLKIKSVRDDYTSTRRFITIDSTPLSQLKREAYVLCYLKDGQVMNISNIFKM